MATAVGKRNNNNNKRFIPLEANPEVMTSLVHNLGLSKSLSFHDVFSIDDPDLLAFIPRPAHALLLVFPVSATYEKFRTTEDLGTPEYTGSGDDDDEDVIWYQQTIGNACGLIGLLHAVSNGHARTCIESGTDLDHLVKKAVTLGPKARAELLEDTEALETAHQAAAATGDSAAPDANDSIDLHYVCFVKGKNGHLWEMDGRRKGPLDRGELTAAEDDVLSQTALDKGVRAFLKREEEAGGGDLRFSLITLAEALD